MSVPIGEKTIAGLERPPTGVLKAFDRLKPCCVYVVGPESGFPVKIGIASDIGKRLHGIQTSNWVELFLHDHFWFAGRPLAERVEKDVHSFLDKAGKRVKREWFSIDPDWATKTIRFWAEKNNYAVYRYQDVIDICIKISRLPPDVGLANYFLPAIREAT